MAAPAGIIDGGRLKSPNPNGGGNWLPGVAPNPKGIGGMRKGETRNPLGGAKKFPLTRALLRVLKQKNGDGVRNDIAICQTLVAMALGQDFEVASWLFERLEGKIPNVQQTQITGSADSPLSIAMDQYVSSQVLESPEVRALAHNMLASIVATAALPAGSST